MTDSAQLADSSPEDLANSIVALLIREASANGVDLTPEHKQVGGGVELTVQVNAASPDRAFYIRLVYVERHNLGILNPALGRGQINDE